MSTVFNQIKQSFMNKLSPYGLDIPNDWLSQCIEFVQTEFPNHRPNEHADLVFKQLLDFDLSLIGIKSLPACLFNSPRGTFNGKFFLQINLCLDSTQSSYSKLQKLKGTLNENALVDADLVPSATQYEKKDKKNRLLTFHLTDGEKKVKAIEYQPMNRLKEDDLLPGTKIELIGPIRFANQVLYLSEANVRVLGGQVEGMHDTDNLIEAIQNELIARNEQYRTPMERIEHFDTSSNANKKGGSTKTEYNSYKSEPSTYSSTHQKSYQSQSRPTYQPGGGGGAAAAGGVKYEPQQQQQQYRRPHVQDNDDDDLLLSIDLRKIEGGGGGGGGQQNPRSSNNQSNFNSNQMTRSVMQPVSSSSSNIKTFESQGVPKIKRLPSEEISVDCINKMMRPNNGSGRVYQKVEDMKKQKNIQNDDDDDEIIELLEEHSSSRRMMSSKCNKENEPSTTMSTKNLGNSCTTVLAQLTTDGFLNSCCRKNRQNVTTTTTVSSAIFNRSTCTHVINGGNFEKFTAPLRQIKLNWYQECLIGDASTKQTAVQAYISNEVLTEMLELTCQEARELFKRSTSQASATSQRPNETSEYAIFEAKRVNCEKKFAAIAQCRMHLKYDLDRNVFCIMKIDQIENNE